MRRREKKSSAPVANGPRRTVVVRFLALFLTLLGSYYVLVLTPWCEQWLYSYLRANAWAANEILRACGQATQVNEVTIRSADFAISVRRGCDAIEPAWFFCSAVLAFPVAWRKKPAALAAGTVFLGGLNLLRIASLFVIGRHLPRFFPPAHLEIWPAIFILAAVGLWLAWLRRALRPAHVSPDGPA